MKTTALTRSIALVALFAVFVSCCVRPVYAGESSVYAKSGWFSWGETLNGSSFVKEGGFIYGVGVARKDAASSLSVSELLEVWGGNLDYDGHDLTGASELKTDTTYLGTREEVAVGLPLTVGSNVVIEPFAALGHKFWIRTRSSEDWNTFYAKAGLGGVLQGGGCQFFLKGGALLPIYTRTHVSLTEAGFTDVTTEPKSEVSGFAEAGVRAGAVSVSVEYEGMRFGQSAKVATSKLTSGSSGVVIQNDYAYQPDSRSSFFSLKLAYAF